jgi:hypothetical protein
LRQDEAVDFETIAEELYGLLPGDFTSARSLRAREARREGDRALANAISELRRPTIGAWLANQLTRERKDELKELLELGAAMRKAQEAEDGSELRRLSQQRRRMITALVDEAKELAHTRNQSVSDNSGRELEDTLEAGVADADAADSLRLGRLAVGLDYSGFGPVGLFGSAVTEASNPTTQRAHSGPGTAEKGKPGPERSRVSKIRPPRPDSATGRSRSRDQQSRLEKALAETQLAVASTEDQVEAIHRQVSEVEAERDRLRDKIEEVERVLRETRSALQEAEHRLTQTQRTETTVEKDAVRAKSQRDKAEASLHRFLSSDS